MASNTPPQAKASNDAYTGMLAISLIALLIGTGAIYMDYSRYAGQPKPLQVTFTEPPAAEVVEPKNRPPVDDDQKDKDKDKDPAAKLNF